ACCRASCTTMRSGWGTSKETPHELPRVHRASVRVLGPRADPAGRAGDPSAPRRLPPVRRALRLRTAVPRLPAGPLSRRGRAPRAETPHPAGAVRRVSWLAPGGLAAALAVGAAVAWGFGWHGLVVLFAFFLSGSLLTQLAERRAPRRTARQVIANGGVAAVAAWLGAWPAAVGAIAAATADTWATELGAFSPIAPRLITTGARVTRGASGGITALGTIGGVAGAAVIAALAQLVRPRGAAPGSAALIAAAGVAGMLGDSLLGATVQAKYECPTCDARFESGNRVCHEPVRLTRGWRWLDNDA